MQKNTFVITGATSGIGNALLKHFCDDAIVFAAYRNEDFVRPLKKLGANIIPFYIDLKRPESISAAAAFINSKTEKIDVLINAAGMVTAGAMEELDIAKIREQFEVNTFAQLDFSQRLLPKLRAAGMLPRAGAHEGGAYAGKIINISSMASFGVFPFVAPYCASKRAMDILFNSLLLECDNGGADDQHGGSSQVKYGVKNVKIVSVKPGVIATPLWEKSIKTNESNLTGSPKYEKEYEYLAENARKNAQTGLDVQKVVDLVAKIEKTENPKPSYTVGFDAKIAELFSKLPQGLVNKIIAAGMKLRF